MEGRAVSHGAITVINAMATGVGAAIGITLETSATVRLTRSPGTMIGRIASEPHEDSTLIEAAARGALQRMGLIKSFGAEILTRSDIPIARGLKSSSAAANAVVLATARAAGRRLGDHEAIGIGVDAAIKAAVTKTGAFDDACASYHGGFFMTDNSKRRVLKRDRVSEDLVVLIHFGKEKAYTRHVDMRKIRRLAPHVKLAGKMAFRGSIWSAMTLNGILYSTAFGYDPEMAIESLKAGALAAGLSGKGPAVAAIVPESRVDEVMQIWRTWVGAIIRSRVNNERAHPLG